MTAMLDEQRSAAAERLRKLVPTLEQFYPEGWVDFRGPMLPDWRAGLFVKVLGNDPPESPLMMKALFGSESLAIGAADQVQAICKVRPEVVPPVDNHSYWMVLWGVDITEACW